MDARILDPPLALITTLAFLHGSYANWAAPAFISAAILVSAVLVREQMWTWLKIHIAFAAFVQVVLLFGDASADRVTASVFLASISIHIGVLWDGGNLRAKRGASRSGKMRRGIISGNTRSDVASLVYYLGIQSLVCSCGLASSTPTIISGGPFR